MKLLNLLLLLLICLSCTHSKQPTGDEVLKQISVDLDNPQNASLLDYFQNIELIPLETSDDVLIGRLTELIYHQNNYYFLDAQQFIVYTFDENGKFMSKIAKRGQGPADYTGIDKMIINPFTGFIDLLNGFGSVYSYDLAGNHIKTIQVTDEDLRAIHGFVALNENRYVLYSMFHSYKIIRYDTKEMKIIRNEYEESAFAQRFPNYTPFYEYQGKWYFYRFFDNITYEIGSDSLIQSYSWDFGKHNYDVNKMTFSQEDYKDIYKLIEAARNFPYWIVIQGQNSQYILAQIYLQNEVPANLMFDKSTQACKFIKHFDESLEFRPFLVSDDYVLSYCTQDELEKYISKELLDDTNRKKFEDLMNAKEEKNPIIIKYHFK